ncbi:MAG TPA: hypothetical protein VEB68_04870 [Croceibacterium sp.]|nr:hypothetical protein [Croceibacterium sp.]
MDQPDITPTPAVRHDGWTPERKVLFLESLSARGNVRVACARVGLSREAAYKLRRRDGLFARAWDAALSLARDVAAETLADRAIDGIEEKIYYRGELIDTRRRYDSRLLLAHMARLDRLAEERAFDEADRFDELLARVAGEPVPEPLDCDDDDELPPARHEFIDQAEDEARERVDEAWSEKCDENGELGDEDCAGYMAECATEVERARLEAAILWDAWHARALAAVDALTATEGGARTPSESSTSLAERSS